MRGVYSMCVCMCAYRSGFIGGKKTNKWRGASKERRAAAEVEN